MKIHTSAKGTPDFCDSHLNFSSLGEFLTIRNKFIDFDFLTI